MIKRLFFIALIILLAVPLAEAKKVSNEKELLKKRVKTYWDLKAKGAFEKTYNYEAPSYRKKHKLTQYIRQFGHYAKIENVKIDKIEFIGKNKAKVFLRMNLTIIGTYVNKMPVPTVDYWAKEKGKWYHCFPEKKAKPKKPKEKKSKEKGKNAKKGVDNT